MPAPRIARRRSLGAALGAPLAGYEDPATRALRPEIPPTPMLTAAEIGALLESDYIDTDLGFFISYPSDWGVDTAEEEGLAIAFKVPAPDTDATGTAYASITVDTYVPEDFPARHRDTSWN